ANGDISYDHGDWAGAAVQAGALTIPTAPATLAASAASSSAINLTRADNSNNETGFKIERSPDGVNFTPPIPTAPKGTSYQDTGLATSTTYYYRVRATNNAGDSAYSNIANATTQAAQAIPAAPNNLVANATSTTAISLTWTDNATNETGFKVERSTDGT